MARGAGVAAATGLGRTAAWLLLTVFAMLICLPLGNDLSGLDLAANLDFGANLDEHRTLAPAPAEPQTLAEALAYPAQLSAYLSDNYGLRDQLVWLDGRLRYELFGELVSDQVVLGRHGRLFFTSHLAGARFSAIDRICGAAVTPAQTAQAAAGLAQLLDAGGRLSPQVYYLSIPTAPIIYHVDLPPWLARRCEVSGVFVPHLASALARQHPDLAARLVYPKPVLDALSSTAMPYPIWNFHWSGLGARAVVEWFADRVLGMQRRVTLTDTIALEPSDLAQFTPGIDHRDMVPIADHARAGIDFCYGGGGACDTEFARFAPVINEISHARWQFGSGPSLLVISDSFGAMAANYLGEYFADVLNLNIAFGRITPRDLAALAGELAGRGRPSVLLFIFHDAAAIDAGGLAAPVAAIAAAMRRPPAGTP